DVGTGANLIYPLLGRSEYGWRFVGSDIDQAALANAAQILAANPTLAVGIELRHQSRPEHIFAGLVGGDERFDFTLCNPPFHADLAEATRGSQRKWRNLGRGTDRQPLLNFGGRHNELMCDGGEAGFLSRMIDQSAGIAGQVFWFTTLVSRAADLPALRARLATLPVRDVRVIPMGQGQKQSRLLAWTFLDKKQRRAWRRARWPACQTAGAAPEVRKRWCTAAASRGHKHRTHCECYLESTMSMLSHAPCTSRTLFTAMTLGVAVFVTGCASTPPPTSQLAVAQQAVNSADTARSAEFAPLELRTAREKLLQAEQANLEKDYDRARELAEQAEWDARVAERKAQAEKAKRGLESARQGTQELREESLRRVQ